MSPQILTDGRVRWTPGDQSYLERLQAEVDTLTKALKEAERVASLAENSTTKALIDSKVSGYLKAEIKHKRSQWAQYVSGDDEKLALLKI
jgi:hypothetical protein